MNTLVTWLSLNSVDDEVKEEFLQTLDFDHFTSKELASDVRQSGLYAAGKIIERMENLFEMKNMEFETLSAKENETRKERDHMKKDMNTVKSNLNRSIYDYHSCTYHNLWDKYVGAGVRSRIDNYL